jgi:hypothetical protein
MGCEYRPLHLVECDTELLSVYRYFYKPYANDWQAIEAVLRLSSKYFIEHLRHRCLSRLAVDWPLSLDKWEARERDAVDDKGKYSPRELAPHPILVISLAREIDHLSFVLPSAFYDLSRYGPKKIVSGAVAPSATDLRLTDTFTYVLSYSSNAGTALPSVAPRILFTSRIRTP